MYDVPVVLCVSGLQRDAAAAGVYDVEIGAVNVFQFFSGKHGFNQTRIQKENLLPRQTITNIRAGKNITLETLNKICVMCGLQPGDIIEVVPTDEERIKYRI